MEQPLNEVPQDFVNPSDLVMERKKLKSNLDKILSGKQKSRKGKKIQELQRRLGEIKKKIKEQNVDLDKENINPPDTPVNQDSSQQVVEMENHPEKSSLQATKSSNSSSDAESDIDSGNFFLRGDLMSSSLREEHQAHIKELMNCLEFQIKCSRVKTVL